MKFVPLLRPPTPAARAGFEAIKKAQTNKKNILYKLIDLCTGLLRNQLKLIQLRLKMVGINKLMDVSHSLKSCVLKSPKTSHLSWLSLDTIKWLDVSEYDFIAGIS